MFFERLATSVCVASTCSTSEVPMPCASAPKAPWVEVWLSPQTTVMPGSVVPFSGPMTWMMPWLACLNGKYTSAPKSLMLASSVSTCRRETGSLMPSSQWSVGVLWSGLATTLLLAPGLAAGQAQALEGLRAGHLVHEVAVDVEQAGAVGFLADDVRFPEFVVKRLASHGLLSSACS
jgi:hypothetical protein